VLSEIIFMLGKLKAKRVGIEGNIPDEEFFSSILAKF